MLNSSLLDIEGELKVLLDTYSPPPEASSSLSTKASLNEFMTLCKAWENRENPTSSFDEKGSLLKQALRAVELTEEDVQKCLGEVMEKTHAGLSSVITNLGPLYAHDKKAMRSRLTRIYSKAKAERLSKFSLFHIDRGEDKCPFCGNIDFDVRDVRFDPAATDAPHGGALCFKCHQIPEFFCEDCTFCLCEDCKGCGNLGAGVCPQGHPLEILGANDKHDWICGGCHSHHSRHPFHRRGAIRNHCSDCKWDACQDCMGAPKVTNLRTAEWVWKARMDLLGGTKAKSRIQYLQEKLDSVTSRLKAKAHEVEATKPPPKVAKAPLASPCCGSYESAEAVRSAALDMEEEKKRKAAEEELRKEVEELQQKQKKLTGKIKELTKEVKEAEAARETDLLALATELEDLLKAADRVKCWSRPEDWEEDQEQDEDAELYRTAEHLWLFTTLLVQRK